MEDGVAHHGGIFVGAENDSHRWVVALTAPQVVVHANVHVHLSDVLVGELARLEIEEDEALEQVVVEDEIDVKVFGLGADALLPSDKGEALAQLSKNA